MTDPKNPKEGGKKPQDFFSQFQEPNQEKKKPEDFFKQFGQNLEDNERLSTNTAISEFKENPTIIDQAFDAISSTFKKAFHDGIETTQGDQITKS